MELEWKLYRRHMDPHSDIYSSSPSQLPFPRPANIWTADYHSFWTIVHLLNGLDSSLMASIHLWSEEVKEMVAQEGVRQPYWNLFTVCTALWHKAAFVRGKRRENYPEPPSFLKEKRRFYFKCIRFNQITTLKMKYQCTGQTILAWMDPTGWMETTQKKSDFLNIIPVTSNNLWGWKDMTRVWSHCHRKTARPRRMKTGGKLVRAQLTSVNLSSTGPCFIPAVKNGPVLQFEAKDMSNDLLQFWKGLNNKCANFSFGDVFLFRSAGCSRSHFRP